MINIPIVGIVVTISPNLSLYKIVVLPAASRPTNKGKVIHEYVHCGGIIHALQAVI